MVVLSFFVIFSTLVTPAFAEEQKSLNEELASSVLPILQSYETDSNYST